MEQQDPPYRKKVYDLLSTNFSDFGKTEEQFYSALDTDTAYAGKVHEVLKSNFADFGRERDEFVSMLSGGEKKSPGSTASPLGSPEPSATPQLPSGGIKVPPAALPGLGSLSVPYRAPAAEQAASPAQDQPAPEPVKPTAQAPAAQRNPLADFEELSSKRMNIQAAESAMTSGGDKFERMISQSASEKMSPSVKAEKERLDKSFSSIMPEVDKQVDEFLKYLNPQSYVMKDVSGLPTVDSEKLSYVAKAKADQLGLPEGGHAWKLLWNAAKDHVAYEIKRPLIEKEAKQIYKETYGADMTADAEKMAKGFGIEAYKARAESSLDNFAKRQMEEQRQLAESEVAAFTNGMPTDKYVESINASRDAAIQELDAAFSMNMTPEGFSGSQQEYDAYKNRFDAINKTAEQAFASILEVETKAMAGANRRYNRAVEEEADRIQRGFERFASQKQPEMEKALTDRARDAYKKASEKVGVESEKAKREYDRSFASEFAYPFASMFGSWAKSMGSAAGSRDLQEWGDFVSTKYNIGSTEIKEWSDWFTDARLALRSTGALAGSMAGTMIPAIAAGVATGGVGGGVVAQTLAGGATGFLAETVDLSSRMYDDTFAETGDAALAMNRAKKVFDSQLMLAPTYSIDMLPFFGKFSGGIVKRFLKGAAMEYASETLLQEYPQNAFEKAIKKDAELSEVYKFMSFEDFNKTAMNTVGVIPMGGGGQVVQEIREGLDSKTADKRLNDNAKSIVAKLKLGKLSESQIQENLLNVVANHGVKQADAVVSAMMASGSITYEQAGGLLSDIKAAEGFVQSASEQNLGNSESYVFTNLRMKLRQAEKIAETEQDPLKKEFAEKNVSKIKKDLEDIFDGKDSRYATISYPNGSFQVLTYDEARKAMKKDGFADTFRNGEVKFEAFGSDAQKLTEELAGVVNRPSVEAQVSEIEQKREDELSEVRRTRGLIAQQTLIPEINSRYDSILEKLLGTKVAKPLSEDQETALSANKKLTEITGGAIGGEAEVEAEITAPAEVTPTETVEQAEEVATAEVSPYPKKYASSLKRAEKDGTEYRELDAKDIDLERSGIELDDNEISSIVLLEDRGPNQEGVNAGTVRIVTKNGAETFEVLFSKPTPPTDAVQEQSTESIPVRQQPEARQGVREEDTQGQEAPQEGEAVKEEVVSEQAPSKPKKPTITKNAAKEVKEVKAVKVDSEGGVTMNMDGTKYSGPGVVIPVMSEDMTQKSVSGKAVAEFIESSPESARSNDNVKVGIYKFKGSNKVSIDLNVMVPPEFLDNALAFAAFAGQESVYDMGAGKTVMSGNDGASPRKFTNEEIADIVESLPKGIEPAVMRGGMMVSGADALSGFKKGDVVDLGIVAGSHFDTVVKAVVGKMSETVSSVRVSGMRASDPAATFNEKTKAIELNKNHEYWKGVPSDGLTSVVAHEGIHHLIDSSPNKEAIEATLQGVKDDLIKRGVYLGIHTGFILSEKNSPQEILAYAVSNPETRSALFRYAKELNPIANELFDKDIITVPKNEGPKPGNRLFNEPLPDASRIADEYFKRVFGDKRPQFKGTREFDSERAKRVAQAFDDMAHDPLNPEVAEAYAAMVAETIEQYKILVEYGYSTEINNSEPYASSADMIADLRDRKVMKIFSTESGFGDTPITDQQRAENPLLADSGFKDINGVPLLANDLFRVVHDFFGHAELGNSFGFKGEENAWNVHARMFSLTARKAMTTETRGQNSYVNFSGVNDQVNVLRARARTLRDAGRDAEAATLVDQIYEMARFADQKIGLLPEEFYTTDDQIAGVEFPQDKEVAQSKKTEVTDKIKELQKSIWGDLNTQGVAWDPKNEAESARKMGEKLTELARLMIEATGISAKEFIDQQIANAMALKGEIYDGLKMAIKDIATKAYEAAKFLPKDKEKKKGKGKSRKKAYERRLMKEYKNSDSLKKAIQANGLDYNVVSWKTVLPMSNEIVNSIFAEKNYVEGIKQLAEDIESTDNGDYRRNEHLSTLHALIAHQVIDELARRGDVKNFRKWTDYFSSDARSQGRFISAMQEDASPFAAKNRAMRSATKQADVAMERATTDGPKVQEHVDEIQEKLKLSEKEVERLTKVIEDLVKQKPPKPQAPPTGSMPQGPTSPRGITSGKAKIQSGLSKLQLGARKARGQASAGVPLNKEIIEGVKELAEGLIQEGIYQADMLIAAVMKEVKKALRGDKELIKEIEKNIESILDIESVEEMMEEDENEKFVQKLVARAKANILDKAPKQKTAEDVLIDVLLNKINEGLPKTKRERVDNTYRKLAEAIANREFSDEIWQQAMRDVESWLDRARITPEQKAEAIGRLEEMASGFMEQPFSNSDLRKAIRLGIKDAGVEVAKVVREHMTKQNATMASLEERLIRELGLDPQSAAEYADVFRAELEKLFEETRAKEINRILNLDTAGMPKKKAERVNRRASDRIMQAMNLGILSDANFRQVFSEKYGFPNIDREKLAMIGMLNDLIHRHQGTEMSRFYEKQLMDYIESLKPWDARKMAVESYSLMIRGMLTGIVTNAVNIPIGSLMSFTAGAMPRILANPVATAAFLKEFNTTGMKGIGKQTFKSIMESGFDPMDGSTQKWEDRGNVTGSAVDYYLNSYDLRKQWESVSNAKGLSGAMKGIAIASARAYLMTSKIANFAQAFDALMSYKGSELDQFIAEYNEQMRLAGGMARNMDTAAIKRIIENTKQYMGYAPDILEEAQDKVDAEIAAMTARGEKVPPGLRQRRIKEELSTRRDVEKMKASLDRVREFVLMEKPQGFSGQAYRAFTEATAIKEGDSTTGVATKMFAKLAFGLFLRITVSSAQRITENIPGVSLALPGIFYEWQNLPVDPAEPNGKKEWKLDYTPKDKMKARLMTHAAVSALAMGAAMVMFSMGDEEEDKYGRKSRKLKLNPDRWLDITGIGTGKWYQNEVLREGDRERKDFMLSIKVNGRWHDIIPARLMPHLLPMIGILGGMRDMATLNPDGFKDATMEEQLANGFDDMAFGMTSFTYASIPKTAQKLMLASNKESSIESGMSLAEEMGTIVLNPMRSAIYPNVLRDIRNEYKALSGDPALMGKGLMWAVAKEVPIAEDMVGNERHDPFGYEKVRTSKVLNAAKEVPGLSIVIDHPMYHAMANEGRFSEPVWKLKSEYHPNLLVNNHYPQGQTADDADLMNKVYGEKMRGLWLSNEEYVKAYDHSQMAKLQEFFNSEAVYLMKMSVAEERVEKLSMAFEEGKKSKVFTSKLGKIEEEMNKWKRVMTHDAPIEYLQEMPETFKAYTEMEMSPEATDARKKSFMINNGLPVLD